MGPSPCGCVRMVAELLFGHQTPCMLPRSISGVLGGSGGLCGPPWVKKGAVAASGYPDPIRPVRRGVPFGRGAVTCDRKLFPLRFVVLYHPQRVGLRPRASQNDVS